MNCSLELPLFRHTPVLPPRDMKPSLPSIDCRIGSFKFIMHMQHACQPDPQLLQGNKKAAGCMLLQDPSKLPGQPANCSPAAVLLAEIAGSAVGLASSDSCKHQRLLQHEMGLESPPTAAQQQLPDDLQVCIQRMTGGADETECLLKVQYKLTTAMHCLRHQHQTLLPAYHIACINAWLHLLLACQPSCIMSGIQVAFTKVVCKFKCASKN